MLVAEFKATSRNSDERVSVVGVWPRFTQSRMLALLGQAERLNGIPHITCRLLKAIHQFTPGQSRGKGFVSRKREPTFPIDTEEHLQSRDLIR